MAGLRRGRNWFGLPGRIAVLLGIGAISAAGVEADAHPAAGGRATAVPQHSVANLPELSVWLEDSRMYVSEKGGAPRELALGDTAEARELEQLLRREGATAASPYVLSQRIILVGGGGQGAPPSDGAAAAPPLSERARQPSAPARRPKQENTSASLPSGGEQKR